MPRITLENLIRIDYDYAIQRIVDFIRSYVRDSGAQGPLSGLVVGLTQA
nr:hypothetical protein [Vulcanisaeta sp. JCM 14467]